MTLIRLGPATLVRSRFAVSPLAETLSTLVALHRGDVHRWTTAHQRRAADDFQSWTRSAADAASLVQLCATTKFLPDAVAIPPRRMETDIDDELAEIRRLPDGEIRASVTEAVTHCWSHPDLRWVQRGDLGSFIAEVMRTGWTRYVEPEWPRRRAVLERDIMFRAGLLAVHGWHHALDDMARGLHWVDTNVIQFSTQSHPDRVVGDSGLVFVPHSGSRGQWTCEATDRFALVYPARGIGVVEPRPADPLVQLLGAGRARVLRALDTAATSTRLAALEGQSLGTVSGHLRTLRETGLVDRTRVGRHVYYRRTPRADQLLDTLAQP